MREQSNPLLVQESKNKADWQKENEQTFKKRKNDLTERISNLLYILSDLQQKTKNAEQERDSVITAIAETISVV